MKCQNIHWYVIVGALFLIIIFISFDNDCPIRTDMSDDELYNISYEVIKEVYSMFGNTSIGTVKYYFETKPDRITEMISYARRSYNL